MMKKGIIVFHHEEQMWRLWIGQQSYHLEQGETVEIRIRNRYFESYLEKDAFDWFVTLEKDVRFVLHIHEVYKVRMNLYSHLSVEDPF